MKERSKIISIVIVNFNTWVFLKNCLESIFTGKFDKKLLEVIVVDNASTQNPPNNYLSNLKVTYIRNDENTGFAKANNTGIKKAKGKYILLLNPDTYLEPDTLAKMYDFMEKTPSAGASTCRLLLPGGTLDDACHRGFPTPFNALCHFTGISRLFPYSRRFNGYHLGYRNLDSVHEIDTLAGAFLFARRDAGEAVSWLSEDYFWYGEDIDFCYRLKRKKWKIFFVPEARAYHHKGVSSGIKKHSRSISTADYQVEERSQKARFDVMRIFYRKHYMHLYPRIITSCVLLGIWVIELFYSISMRLRRTISSV